MTSWMKHAADVQCRWQIFSEHCQFIHSGIRIRKQVGYEEVNKQKPFRLNKLLTKLRKVKRGKAPVK